MRYPKEHKEQVRCLLVKEASKAIRSCGVGGVSLAAIMGRVGLTNGGFYGYFASKDALIAEAIGEMFRDRYEKWLSSVETSDAGEQLGRFLDFYLSSQHVANAETGCPIPTLAGAIAQMDPITKKEVASGVAMATNGMAGVLARLGIGNEGVEARLLMAELVGAVTLARLAGDREEAERTLLAARHRVTEKVSALRLAAAA